MIMRRCPVSGGKPCGRVRLFDDGGTPCGECIADRRGNKMPVLCGGNSVEILNPDLLIMSDRSSALEPFDFAVLKFTDEKELKPVLDMYQNNGKPLRAAYPRSVLPGRRVIPLRLRDFIPGGAGGFVCPPVLREPR